MASRSARFAATLAALLVAHNVGDHLAQTDHQAGNKATDWGAMTGHVGGYTAVAAAGSSTPCATAGSGSASWPPKGRSTSASCGQATCGR